MEQTFLSPAVLSFPITQVFISFELISINTRGVYSHKLISTRGTSHSNFVFRKGLKNLRH